MGLPRPLTRATESQPRRWRTPALKDREMPRSWYVLRTKCGKEHVVAQQLTSKGTDVFFPRLMERVRIGGSKQQRVVQRIELRRRPRTLHRPRPITCGERVSRSQKHIRCGC